jgi:hypothetical protein
MAYESHSTALSSPGLVYIMPLQCDLSIQDKHPRCASGKGSRSRCGEPEARDDSTGDSLAVFEAF